MPATPKRKFVLGKSFYFGAVGLIVLGLFEGFEYSRIGSSPQNMTAAESIAVLHAQSGKHWVQMTGLQVDCAKPVQEVENGKVNRTFYLATDEGKHQMFVLDYSGPCDPNPAHVYEGVLEPTAGAYILKQVAASGVAIADDERIPRLAVGNTPSSTRNVALFLGGVGVMVLFGTWWSRNKA